MNTFSPYSVLDSNSQVLARALAAAASVAFHTRLGTRCLALTEFCAFSRITVGGGGEGGFGGGDGGEGGFGDGGGGGGGEGGFGGGDGGGEGSGPGANTLARYWPATLPGGS
jgi:hypothetical protein